MSKNAKAPGPARTPAKFSRIFQWIEVQDPEFAAAIRLLCVEGILTPRRSGVTFLYPDEAGLRNEITEGAYGENAEDAVRLFRSLVIPDFLPQSGEFKARPIGNSLGVLIGVEAAEGARVRLAGGAELVPADFRGLSGREGLAVWRLVKGRPPLEGPEYKAPRAEPRPKTGGGPAPLPSGRGHLARQVEADFDRCMREGRCAAGNPYLAKAVSLLNFLRLRHPELYAAAMLVADYDPAVTFYLLVEPYKTRGEPLLPETALFGDAGWDGGDAYTDASAEYQAHFAGLSALGGAPVFADRAGLARQVDSLRQKFQRKGDVRAAPKFVASVYAALAEQNSIGGANGVLPAAPGNAARKLWQDEFRYIIHAAFAELQRSPVYDPAEFAELVGDIRNHWAGNDYVRELRITDEKQIQSSVAPRDAFQALVRFICSTDFLYMPVAPDAVGERWGNPADPECDRVYNRNFEALGALTRIRGMVRPGGLSPQALQELAIYVRANGRLPPEVAALCPAS